MFTMCVAFFLVHAQDPWGKKELAFLFGCIFLSIVLAGPGRFSLDALIFGRKKSEAK